MIRALWRWLVLWPRRAQVDARPPAPIRWVHGRPHDARTAWDHD